jgi:diguanylate cyclase (GGDEF)-like protein
LESILDLRTLAYNNLITGIVLGVGMLLYANVNKPFSALRYQGIGFILFSLGFLLLGMRHFVDEFVSVILANSLAAVGFFLTCDSVLRFLEVNRENYHRISFFLLVLLLVGFIYFTYIDSNINARVFIISAFVSALSLLLFLEMRNKETDFGRPFFIVLKYILLLMGLVFLARGLFSLNEQPINNFMNASTWHGISFIAFEVMFIIIALSTTGLANAKLAKELEMQAIIDPLTGLNNRRALNREVKLELSRCKRSDRTFSLVLIDIDYFKSINDNYGHQTGDKVLIEFSKWLTVKVRTGDFVARFGGEEFVILLNDVDSSLLIKVAKELTKKISEHQFQIDQKTFHRITISIGVASSQELGYDWSKLLEAADKRLYSAKSNGRNQVVWE